MDKDRKEKTKFKFPRKVIESVKQETQIQLYKHEIQKKEQIIKIANILNVLDLGKWNSQETFYFLQIVDFDF